jgi:hypothetical protein
MKNSTSLPLETLKHLKTKTEIYFICYPDIDRPIGGVKQIYRQVDILNQNNFRAFVLHKTPGFRCSWFANNTPIAYVDEVRQKGLNPQTTFLVLPETYANSFAQIAPGIPKVIFNQNAYYTFGIPPGNIQPILSMYRHPELKATLVVSEDSYDYLKFAFSLPALKRIQIGIKPDIFYPGTAKKLQICFMPRKNSDHVQQVLNLLQVRGCLEGIKVISIHQQPETRVAEIFRESLLFLSFGYPEGFSLPPAEAMACGCVAVGYTGNGGREYFQADFSYPLAFGDILLFAKTVDNLLLQGKQNPEFLITKGLEASHYISNHYSLERESESIVQAWHEILTSSS